MDNNFWFMMGIATGILYMLLVDVVINIFTKPTKKEKNIFDTVNRIDERLSSLEKNIQSPKAKKKR